MYILIMLMYILIMLIKGRGFLFRCDVIGQVTVRSL